MTDSMNVYEVLAILALGRTLVSLATIAAVVTLVRDGHPGWAVVMIVTCCVMLSMLDTNATSQRSGDS